MKVFLSWSGQRSQQVAETLKSWLPDVIQAVDPWVSSQDVSKGSRALSHVASSLEGANFGIICVTPEHQDSQWLNFEAGALSKQLDKSFVFPFLVDIGVADLTGPLSQFQATDSTSQEDVLKLLSDINTELESGQVSEARLKRVFEKSWQDLHGALHEIRNSTPEGKPQQRSAQDMFSELTILIRKQDRRLNDLAGYIRSGNRPGRWPSAPDYLADLAEIESDEISRIMLDYHFTPDMYRVARSIDGTIHIVLLTPTNDHTLKQMQLHLKSQTGRRFDISMPSSPKE
ncbi:TIR domain-containing protein [Streptomyces sp. NPDC088090]|uniref:TIR domain-containing protein n=1 Tax=Streptomyces sp. NPDC088090 TaxID=3365822 RepID=UPI00384C775D